MIDLIIGVDPGRDGGMAVIDTRRPRNDNIVTCVDFRGEGVPPDNFEFHCEKGRLLHLDGQRLVGADGQDGCLAIVTREKHHWANAEIKKLKVNLDTVEMTGVYLGHIDRWLIDRGIPANVINDVYPRSFTEKKIIKRKPRIVKAHTNHIGWQTMLAGCPGKDTKERAMWWLKNVAQYSEQTLLNLKVITFYKNKGEVKTAYHDGPGDALCIANNQLDLLLHGSILPKRKRGL